MASLTGPSSLPLAASYLSQLGCTREGSHLHHFILNPEPISPHPYHLWHCTGARGQLPTHHFPWRLNFPAHPDWARGGELIPYTSSVRPLWMSQPFRACTKEGPASPGCLANTLGCLANTLGNGLVPKAFYFYRS